MSARPRGLLPTKLHPRQAGRRRLARPRLLEALERCASAPLSLIHGPAGAGKSTAAVAWLEHTELEVAWVSLDPSDDRPSQLFAYVFAALANFAEELTLEPQTLLEAPELDRLEALLADELVIPLVERTRPLVLVLDDYHLIEDPRIHAAFDWLLEHGPACLRLMLLSRTQPPLALARARARGLLVEIGPRQLYFEVEETRRFLAENVGLEIEASEALQLHAQLEGWPAGTQLAALSWQRHPQHALEPAGSDRFIADYLLAEVFTALVPELREFLLESALLERFCAPLVAAISASDDARMRLSEVEEAGLFLIPLDAHGRWFRYHHLFRDFLRAEGQARGPQWAALRHARAAAWLAERNFRREAFEHAVAAGEAERVQSLFERWAGETLMRNQTGEIRRWLAMVPSSLRARVPVFGFIEGWCDVVIGQLRRGDALLADAIARHVPGSGWPQTDALVLGLGPMLRTAAAARAGRYEQALAGSAAIQAQLRAQLEAGHSSVEGAEVEGLRIGLAGYGMLDGLIHLERGDLERAEQALAESEAFGSTSPEGAAGAVRTLAHYAELHRRRGRLDEAERYARRALRLSEAGGVDPAALGLARAELAWVALERGNPGAALEQVEQALERLRLLRDMVYLAHATELLARARAALGEREEALEIVDESLDLLAGTDMAPAHARMSKLRAELGLAGEPKGTASPVPVRAEPEAPLPPDLLTPRELEVLELIATGASNRELAKQLHVSVGTIKTHVHRVLHKLEVPNRTRAVHRARSAGLLPGS